MNKKYLILDCNYLCHRAKHTTGDLTYDGNATGIIYSLLRSLSGYQDLFDTSDFVFCFDSKTSKRKEIYPEYKASREREYTQEEIEYDRTFRKQIKKLRTTYLPMIGFRNIFIQKGYESDDLMAEICLHIKPDDEAIIITSDKDLYQCISGNVFCYNPQTNKRMTLQRFKKEYEILPELWSLVKAIAGCSTDNIKGIEGIGEKRATQYINLQLKSESKVYKSIKSKAGYKIINRNLKLVALPMEGTQGCKLRRDKLSESGWKEVCKLLGMKSIKNRMPFGKGRR